MIKKDLDHCRVVSEWLNGASVSDDQAGTSLAVLDDRLERLKRIGHRYADISFSPTVQAHVDRVLAPAMG